MTKPSSQVARSLFSGNAEWIYIPELKHRKSRVCFVYPGQGAMFPGMAKRFTYDATFFSYCARSDQFLKKRNLPSVSDYLFFKKRLTLEQQEQVEVYALFTFEVALSHLLIEQGICPSVVTGHSFGEYAALVVSGLLSFESGLESISQREAVLPERNVMGYMLAVSLPEREALELLPPHQNFISVINSEDQTVLSVDWLNLIDIEDVLKAKGIRFKRLNSPQPFHSPLLQKAANRLEPQWCSEEMLGMLITPVFSGVIKRWLKDSEKHSENIQQILRAQLTEPVDFIQQVQEISEAADHFIELSPKAFLSPLIKRIAPKKEVTWAGDFLRNETSGLPEKDLKIAPSLLSRINAVISRVTGYSIDEIRLEKRFQEDLGIDSIKTMELSIEVMTEFQIPREQVVFSRQVKTVGDLALMVQNRLDSGIENAPERKKPKFQGFHESLLISPLPDKKNNWDNSAQITWLQWSPINSWRKSSELLMTSIVVIELQDEKWSLTQDPMEPLMDFVVGIQNEIQSGKIHPDTSLILVSRQGKSPWSRGFSGFFKSLKKENEIAFFCHINWDDETISRAWLEQEIIKNLEWGCDPEVAYQEGHRFIKVLNEITEAPSYNLAGGKALVVGGAKGIGFELLKRLPEATSWKLTLIGRSAEKEVCENIQELRKCGFECRYEPVDFTDSTQVKKFSEQEKAQNSPASLVIQGAGMQLSKKLRDKTLDEIAMELKTKIETTLHLLRSGLISEECPKQLMSSVIARFGNHGQSIYALAGGFAEAIWQENSRGEKFSCIQWPPWNGVGMTESKVVLGILEAAGVSLISADEAYSWWRHSFSAGDLVVMGTEDYFLYQTPLLDFREMGAQIKEVVPTQGRVLISFQMSDYLLHQCRDHALQDQPVVPLAWVAQWFLRWGRRVLGREGVLKELAVYRFLKAVPNNRLLNCELAQENEKSSAIKLILKDSQGLIAEALFEELKERSVSYHRVFENSESKFLLNNFYSPGKCFHGPAFQFLKEVQLQMASTTARAEIQLPQILEEQERQVWSWYQLLDGALQTAGVYLLEVHHFQAIPMGVHKLWFCNEGLLEGKLVCELADLTIREGIAEGTLCVFNPQDEMICKMEGARYRLF